MGIAIIVAGSAGGRKASALLLVRALAEAIPPIWDGLMGHVSYGLFDNAEAARAAISAEAASLLDRDKADAAMRASGGRVEHKPFF